MEILVDFDGTCVTHEYPEIGKEIGAVPVLKQLINNGHNLILFTMRSGEKLNEAVKWFNNHEIPLYGIQTNPTQSAWTTSPKAYGQLIIDDICLGIPLTKEPLKFKKEEFYAKYNFSPFLSSEQVDGYCYYECPREYVDWAKVKQILKNKKLIGNEL